MAPNGHCQPISLSPNHRIPHQPPFGSPAFLRGKLHMSKQSNSIHHTVSVVSSPMVASMWQQRVGRSERFCTALHVPSSLHATASSRQRGSTWTGILYCIRLMRIHKAHPSNLFLTLFLRGCFSLVLFRFGVAMRGNGLKAELTVLVKMPGGGQNSIEFRSAGGESRRFGLIRRWQGVY